MTFEHARSRAAPRTSFVDGGKIRRRRFGNALQQQQLAAAVGISVSYMCDIERGHRSPGPVLLGRIATRLGCSPADLLVDEQTVASA